jgi:AcrR family transcriptional regulator
VPNAAGVAKGTIYRHFEDNCDLFQEVLMALAVGIGEELRRLPERAGERTVRQTSAP